MNEIQRGGLNRVLQRSLTIKGDLPPAPVVGAEIIATLPLEVDRPEWGYYSGTRWAQTELSSVGVAGQFCKHAIWNPPNSGILVVVTNLSCYSGTATLSVIEYIADPLIPDFTTLFQGFPAVDTNGQVIDSRWAERQLAGNYNDRNSAVRVGALTSGFDFVGGSRFIGDICAPINTVTNIISKTGRLPFWILPPGWFLGTRGAANMALCSQFTWYERALEPNEGAPAPSSV